ncbi:hypothetical protein [Ferrimonas gelatinilytica]|uniref:DUF4258 domain-containing protein n=1 Tax=Ferrimonas gelatinilytica TaxID=1255257 RepID=A0ABP9S4N6_9GAMM
MKINSRAHRCLIRWLKEGNALRMISEMGVRHGTWEGIETYPGPFSERVVFQLIEAGSLRNVTEYVNGVRYERIALTDSEG